MAERNNYKKSKHISFDDFSIQGKNSKSRKLLKRKYEKSIRKDYKYE